MHQSADVTAYLRNPIEHRPLGLDVDDIRSRPA